MNLKKAALLSTILSTLLFTGVDVQAQGLSSVLPFIETSSPVLEQVNSDFVKRAGVLDPASIKTFYEERGGDYYWQGILGVSRDADYMITVLEKAWQHGLNPETYHLKEIKELRPQKGTTAAAQLEILLTDAFVRYVRDMSGMRVKAASLGLDPTDWLQPYTVRQVLAFLTEKRNIKGILNGLPPRSQTYAALQAELIRLADAPPEPYLSVLPISLDGYLLKPAERHRAVPAIRARLEVEPQTQDVYRYDDRLAAAVMKFQRESGLPADGVVGPTTLKLLNRSNYGKMLQIVANLERLRWVDDRRPDKFVLVNIPAATLWAVENQQVAFQMPVVVGKPGRETQPFIANITGVRFNPDWTVPPTIKREDILPKLVENPDYLNDKGMELIYVGAGGAQTIDPHSVDWKNITKAELASLEMVQIPGAHNPLGRVRVLMPNPYDIYLHDTNQQEYFERNTRAQSSGCIRMKEPLKMAQFIMEAEEGWSETKMDSILARGRTQDMKIAHEIPVYILYYTAWSDEQGEIVFGNDIYDFDRKLLDKLSDIDGFALPGHNKTALVSSDRSKLVSAN